MKQLQLFLNERNKRWLRDGRGYWVELIFGKKS